MEFLDELYLNQIISNEGHLESLNLNREDFDLLVTQNPIKILFN